MTTQQATSNTPRRSALDRDVAMRLASTEYDKVVELFEQLDDDQWRRATDCTGWDVRAMAGHMLGMAQMAASVPELLRQQVATMRRAKRDACLSIDAMTALQVEKNAGLSTQQLVEGFRRTGPKAAKGRRRTPAFVRARRMPEEQEFGGQREPWTFGYLLDVILTRDPFMHRIDITHVTGASMRATADHEGVIVDDVVREWAQRHGAPYTLHLTGPAGGHWHRDQGGEVISMDALDFCRVLSGRAPGTGLLSRQLPF